LEWQLLSINAGERKGDERMREIFNGQGIMSLDSLMDLSALRDEIERYESLPGLMNLYEKVNGFFDTKFESYWEEKTGTPWKEWGEL
jgi:hypothetical protein